MIRVLVDAGTRNCRNMGDVAMLQVALARIADVLPDAAFEVFTEDPAALSRHCPGAAPVSHAGRQLWLDEWEVWGPLRHGLPRPLLEAASRVQRRVRTRWPSLYRRAILARYGRHPELREAIAQFLTTFNRTDLLLFCGQGTLADSVGAHALCMLATAEFAEAVGVPVAYLGQGVGPLSQPDMVERARRVLPRAGLIALREERRGREVLQSLGVPSGRIVATGDDAIELAYHARPTMLGTGLGVHLRLSPLALTNEQLLAPIRNAIREFLRDRPVPLIPLPISHHPVGTYDPKTIRLLLTGLDDASDGGATTDTPVQVIHAAGRCRLILTGAYHAAVFGLAQGVPVVCLGRSDYYVDKFEGLQQQFGAACQVLRVDVPELEGRLLTALKAGWMTADTAHEPLLQIARHQIEHGREACSRIAEWFPQATAGALGGIPTAPSPPLRRLA